jgi:hypothetical protein
MNHGLKRVIIGMAAGALGISMVACGGDDAEATEGTETETSGGEGHCGEGAEHAPGEASCSAEGGGEAGGGEASCAGEGGEGG